MTLFADARGIPCIYQALTVLFMLGILLVPSTAVLAAESIDDYVVDIHINQQGQLEISEQITYNFSNNERHGIYRDIPLNEVPDDASSFMSTRYIDVSIDHILRNSQKEPYSVESNYNTLSLRIGDPGVTHTGAHTYTIDYVVDGAVVNFSDGPVGIYWNAIGDEWDVSIAQATVRISADENILINEVSRCLRGEPGLPEECKRVQGAGDSGVITFQTTKPLDPGQAMTVMQSVNPQQIIANKLERINLWYLLVICIGIIIIAFAFFAYRFKTKHKIQNPDIVQYEPYEDVHPMYAGLLIDGRLHTRDITAGIVFLAQQGYIKINKIGITKWWLYTADDFEITRLKETNKKLQPFLHVVFHLLFTSDQQQVRLSQLRQDYKKQASNNSAVEELKQALREELRVKGFYESPYKSVVTTISITLSILVFGLAVISQFVSMGWWWVIVVLLGAFMSLGLSLSFSRRLTPKGYQAQYHLEGFKTYLAMTQKERYEFHNNPADSPQEFMRYLPYAIAFGVEDNWAEVFKDVPIAQPEWYASHTGHDFSAAALTSSLDVFSGQFSQAGGSVSSSGGGVGGGAGGGGGGSW